MFDFVIASSRRMGGLSRPHQILEALNKQKLIPEIGYIISEADGFG
jgi:hypothetical protein